MRTTTKVLYAAFFLVAGASLARAPQTIATVRMYVAAWGGAATSDADVNWREAFDDVAELIREKYVESPSEAEMYKGAIQGLTDSLNDPHTQFIAPSERAAFEKDLTGQFVGIGASVSIRGGWLTIAYPLESSPAYRAGLRPGDQVRAVNGETTRGLTVDQCVERLMGAPGTEVTLSVWREDEAKDAGGGLMEVVIRRAPINARAVKGYRWDAVREDWDYRIDPAAGIAYVRLEQFTPGVASEFRAALASAGLGRGAGNGGSPCAGLIIDLRDNPGGLMDQAIEIVDAFLDEGTIVSTRGRSAAGEVFAARRGSVGDVPVAVLVNQGSASASEIVAGALADNGRAVVIGTRTFGKGLVQRVERLVRVPGAHLKLTEQHYYLPSGRMIQRTDASATWGVDPSEGFYVGLSDEQQRRVWAVKRAMEVIRPPVRDESGRVMAAPVGGARADRELAELVAGAGARWSDPLWIDREAKDPQLSAALRAVQRRVAEGQWVKTGSERPDQAGGIAAAELTRLQRERERIGRYMGRLDERIGALAGGRVPTEPRRPGDLWSEEVDLTGGRLEVFDKDGTLVSTLDVTGPDLERWLLDAEVKVRGAEEPVPPGH